MKDLDFLYAIAKEYSFGEVLEKPHTVKGGFCHVVYKLNTTSGIYLIKLVGNNSPDNKPFRFWKEKDKMEDKLFENKIPAVYSLVFNGSRVQQLNNQMFYVYPWFEGEIVRGRDASKKQTKLMAKYSALINNIEYNPEAKRTKPVKIDWQYYIDYAKGKNQFIYDSLVQNKAMLDDFVKKGNNRLCKMPKGSALSHCDMDYKNVMWTGDKCKLIDMDSIGYSNPYMLLFKNALVWSGYEECQIDYERFALFIKTYFKFSKLEKIKNLEDYFYATLIGPEWLEVNVKRALGLVGDSQALIEMGLSQTQITLDQIKNFIENKDKIINIKL